MDQCTNQPDLVLAEGLEEAFLGVGIRRDGPNVTVYSIPRAVNLLCSRLGFERDEARQFLYDRMQDVDLGEGTPVWVEEMTVEELRGLMTQPPTVH